KRGWSSDVCSSDLVGATILDGRTLKKVQTLQAQIGQKWPGNLEVMNAINQVSRLKYQKVPQQRRRSYYYEEGTDIDKVKALVTPLGCEVLLSKGQYLDILPQGINKGYSIKQLVSLMEIDPNQVLVAGDTMNDFSLFETGYKGVVVGAAEDKLSEATMEMEHVYHAEGRGAGGISEAMGYFHEFSKWSDKQCDYTVQPHS